MTNIQKVLHEEFGYRRGKDEETLEYASCDVHIQSTYIHSKIMASNFANEREKIIKEHQEDISLLLKRLLPRLL